MKKTSIIANRIAEKGLKAEHFAKILSAMKDGVERNYHAIAKRAGLDPTAVARRLPEMVKDGCLQETGNVSPSPSNRPCTNYIINTNLKKAS